ncbi:uncharacterized protein LOC124280455 [Haliotis rubra]|uniref:uncharacterized protein LOC124280455 n=1 Tax=Haliotis rubra TaxID=36100 RepID=UPI001EE59655|nr:uncharacterized protein LOC124280455 [Haliotis rubra]
MNHEFFFTGEMEDIAFTVEENNVLPLKSFLTRRTLLAKTRLGIHNVYFRYFRPANPSPARDMSSHGPSLPQWTRSPKSLPPVESSDIEAWSTNCRIPTAIYKKAYSNFVESYIHDVEVRTACDGSFIRAKCYKSMKKNDFPHTLNIKISQHQDCDDDMNTDQS